MSPPAGLPDPLPTNDAIEWTGQRYGLRPYLDAGSDLGSAGADDVEALAPRLVEALADPDRFAVAHVLLTRLSRVSYPTFPDWNGLAVELAVDGSSHVDPAQRDSLARRWRAWVEAQPHPLELPPDQ
ncbi:MAG TPA: hypothetical protein VFL38_01055 [Humibacillus xanthopallidus]|nr:hypothetical protein [Humibacillus xanthopallidus]